MFEILVEVLPLGGVHLELSAGGGAALGGVAGLLGGAVDAHEIVCLGTALVEQERTEATRGPIEGELGGRVAVSSHVELSVDALDVLEAATDETGCGDPTHRSGGVDVVGSARGQHIRHTVHRYPFQAGSIAHIVVRCP